MKKNDVFTFTAPNGVKVQAITIRRLFLREDMTESVEKWLCYAQNRLVIIVQKVVYIQHPDLVSLLKFMRKEQELTTETKIYLQDILVDYAILPEYDECLARYNDIEVAQAETANGM